MKLILLNRAIKRHVNFWRQEAYSGLRKLRLYLTAEPEYINHLKPTIKCRKSWYGSSYGGFFLHPNVLNSQSVVYSFGIGKDITFDLAVIRNHGCTVHGFDPTPKSIGYINLTRPDPRFQFHAYGIAAKTGLYQFYLPASEYGVSGSIVPSPMVSEKRTLPVDLLSLSDIAGQLGHQHIHVLKMDIEGAEYSVIESILASGITIDQLLVEFHDRMEKSPTPRSRETVSLLHNHGFQVFAASASHEEISFIHSRVLNGNATYYPKSTPA